MKEKLNFLEAFSFSYILFILFGEDLILFM